MSDNEGTAKKSGYRLEYANSARSKCKGPKPCSGTTILKGALRLGSIVDFRGHTNYAWRHWGCTTTKIISNMKAQFETADELDGFEDLNDDDKDRVRRAFDEGKVADEDIPETARKAEGEEEVEKPKKKRAPAKKADAEEDGEEKPKKKRATKAKKIDDEADGEEKPKGPTRKPRAKKVSTESEVEDGAESGEKPKKRAPAKKPAAEKKALTKKRAAKKKEESESEEDFAEEIAELEDDGEEEETEAEEAVGKKRKRSATSKAAAASKKPKGPSRAKKEKVIEYTD